MGWPVITMIMLNACSCFADCAHIGNILTHSKSVPQRTQLVLALDELLFISYFFNLSVFSMGIIIIFIVIIKYHYILNWRPCFSSLNFEPQDTYDKRVDS